MHTHSLRHWITLCETMSREQAQEIFRREGYPTWSLATPDALRKAYTNLQHQYHEAGSEPNQHRIALINVAYSLLKAPTSLATPAEEPGASASYQVWGWDGRLFTKGFTINATPESFPNIAMTAMQRMRSGFKRPKAILLQDSAKHAMLLIFSNGQPITPPLTYPVYGDPGRDEALRKWLITRAR